MRASRVAVISLTLSVVAALLGAPVSAQSDPPAGANVYALDDVAWIDPADPSVDIDVTDNDSYPAGDLTVTINADPTDGTATVGTVVDRPMVTYSPNNGFGGTDTVGYEICVDGDCDQGNIDVYVGNSACTIVGTNGADTLTGTEGDDVICGRKGQDTINGLGGDDVILGGKGADVLDGGAGNDSIFGGRGNDIIRGGDGDDLIKGGRGDDTLTGGDGNDRIAGKEGADQLNGGPGDDVLRGWQGPDELNGGPGNDRLYGGKGQDVLNGGEGDDELWGRQHADQLHGGPGNDVLRGNLGPDDLYGGPGVDDLYGGQGNDTCRTGETNTGCETIIDPDTEPPTVEAAVDNQLETTGQLTLTYTITDNSGPVDNVVLVDPGGYSYEIAPNGDGTWTAQIDTDRLFPDTTYDFVVLATDQSDNTAQSQTISITTPESDRVLPTKAIPITDGVSIDQIVGVLAETGVQPVEVTLGWAIESEADIPTSWLELLADEGTDPATMIGQTVLGSSYVNAMPLSMYPSAYRGLLEAEAGTNASPGSVTVIAPSDTAMADVDEFATGLTPVGFRNAGAAPATSRASHMFDPASLSEPFWPDRTLLHWADEAPITVKKCDVPLGCPFGWGVEEATFWSRSLSASISGLDTRFRPYFDTYGSDRSYELDVKQVDTDEDHKDFENQWLRNFDGVVDVVASQLGRRTCPATAAVNFPMQKYAVEEYASHDYSSIEAFDSFGSLPSLFTTNANDDAKAYPDAWAGDYCHEFDLSFGLAQPHQLDPDLDRVVFSIRTSNGNPNTTTLSVGHQSLDYRPDDSPDEWSDTNQLYLDLCRGWSVDSGFFDVSVSGVLQPTYGHQFCVGVIKEKTRDIRITAAAGTPGSTATLLKSNPWIPMGFRPADILRPGDPAGACFDIGGPNIENGFATAYTGDRNDVTVVSVPFQLASGLVSSCGSLGVTSPHVLPPLQAGVPYSYQLQAGGGSWNPISWRAVEDPVSRYRREDTAGTAINYRQPTQDDPFGGLPKGLSLNAATGLITGTPAADVGTNQSFMTVVVGYDNGQTAIKQFVFGVQPSQNGGVTIDVTPEELTTTGITGFARFVLTNDGIVPLQNYVLRVEFPPGVTPSSDTYLWVPVPGQDDTYTTTFPDVPGGQARQVTVFLDVPADYLLFDGAFIWYSWGPGSASSDYPYVYWWAFPQL